MNYPAFEADQFALQNDMVERYDRAFRQFSNQELVRVFHEMIALEDVTCILELGAHRAPCADIKTLCARPGRPQSRRDRSEPV